MESPRFGSGISVRNRERICNKSSAYPRESSKKANTSSRMPWQSPGISKSLRGHRLVQDPPPPPRNRQRSFETRRRILKESPATSQLELARANLIIRLGEANPVGYFYRLDWTGIRFLHDENSSENPIPPLQGCFDWNGRFDILPVLHQPMDGRNKTLIPCSRYL